MRAALPRDFPGGRLRRLRAGDLAAFQAYRAIPELGRYQGWSPMAEAEARAFLAEMSGAELFRRGEWVQLGIADAGTDLLVGDIGLHLSEDGLTAEVGFTLAPQAQRRGVATRAVREAVGLVFGLTDATRVLGITDARNGASVRLLERLGFGCVETREAIFRGEVCLEMVFSLARERAIAS